MTNHPFPFLRVKVILADRDYEEEALLDTGFGGDVAIPAHYELGSSETTAVFTLADGSIVRVRSQRGQVQIGNLEPVPAEIVSIGSSMGVLSRYEVILDHGRRVIVNP